MKHLNFESIKQKYLTGNDISKKEQTFIKTILHGTGNPTPLQQENARVLLHCLKGNILHDKHTRNLAQRRNTTILTRLLQESMPNRKRQQPQRQLGNLRDDGDHARSKKQQPA